MDHPKTLWIVFNPVDRPAVFVDKQEAWNFCKSNRGLSKPVKYVGEFEADRSDDQPTGSRFMPRGD